MEGEIKKVYPVRSTRALFSDSSLKTNKIDPIIGPIKRKSKRKDPEAEEVNLTDKPDESSTPVETLTIEKEKNGKQDDEAAELDAQPKDECPPETSPALANHEKFEFKQYSSASPQKLSFFEYRAKMIANLQKV